MPLDDATATSPSRDRDSVSSPNPLVVWIIDPSTSNARRIPVKMRRRRPGAIRNQVPGNTVIVHVRLRALVPALVPQRLLKRPQKVLVRGKEVVVVVQLAGVRHVVGDKVVVAGQGAWELVLGRLWGELGQAHDGRDVLLSLGDGQVGPFSADAGVGERAVVVGACGDLFGEVGFDFGAGCQFDFVDDVEGVIGVALAGVLSATLYSNMSRGTCTLTFAAYVPATAAASARGSAALTPTSRAGRTNVLQTEGMFSDEEARDWSPQEPGMFQMGPSAHMYLVEFLSGIPGRPSCTPDCHPSWL